MRNFDKRGGGGHFEFKFWWRNMWTFPDVISIGGTYNFIRLVNFLGPVDKIFCKTTNFKSFELKTCEVQH